MNHLMMWQMMAEKLITEDKKNNGTNQLLPTYQN